MKFRDALLLIRSTFVVAALAAVLIVISGMLFGLGVVLLRTGFHWAGA